MELGSVCDRKVLKILIKTIKRPKLLSFPFLLIIIKSFFLKAVEIVCVVDCSQIRLFNEILIKALAFS